MFCLFSRGGRRGALLAAGLAAAVAGPAEAQQILPDLGGESCKVTEQCEKHEYTFVAGPGQFFHHWTVAGDERLLSLADQNPAWACSAGYGKGRLTAHYYAFRKVKDDRCRELCPDTVWHTLNYDLFKSFKAPDPINGPACVRAGQSVTFSVPPLLTDWDHRRAGIGTDSYFWSGWPAGATVRFSGDSSAVTVDLPTSLTDGFTMAVRVGRCNPTPVQLEVAIDQELATAVRLACGGGPVCTRLEISTFPGVLYVVSLPMSWSFSSGSSGTLTGNGQVQTVAFTTDGGWGNVVVTATGGCGGPQTTGLVFQVTP